MTFSSSIIIRHDKNFLLSPITTASDINGLNFNSFSISDGDIFFPPAVMIMSFFYL